MNQQPTSKKFSISSRLIFFAALVFFIGVAIVGSVVSYSIFHGWGAQEGGLKLRKTPVFNDQGTLVAPDEDQPSGLPPLLSDPVGEIDPPPTWDGNRRITMLVMGVDYRDWEAGSPYSRTDTMMLLTIDPVAKTAGALSIPRDLWAAIPGFKPAKINAAHYYGDLYNYPGGGIALAVKTVENVIGVPIDYYARIDFNAFVEFVDLIDGVKVDVEEKIELEIIGQDYDVVLEPGTYALDGKLALAYARNRYNDGGDFDRARRQQQVILGIRDRLLQPKVWARMISNAPTLYNHFSQQITTNLSLEDAIRLAALAIQVEREDIDMAVINEQQVQFGTSPDERSILIPFPDKIRELRDRIFGTGGSFSPAMQGDAQALMQIEEARIIIYDGTTGGSTAQRTADYLRNLGGNVVEVRGAGQTYAETTLIDHTGSPYTLAYLSNLMGVGTYRIMHKLDLNSSTDVEVWIGTNWQYNNSLP
ncbi:MAG: LCP family protein [Anaerolineales bacterium]|jgi:LCP family protein required for cell wall assembly